jgi:toxin ParE1/3/4
MPDFRLTKKAMDDLRSLARFTQEKWGRDQRNKYFYMLDAGFNRIAQQPEANVKPPPSMHATYHWSDRDRPIPGRSGGHYFQLQIL